MTFAGILSTLQLFAKQQTSFITNHLMKILLNLDIVCPVANSKEFLGILGQTVLKSLFRELVVCG